MTEGTTVVYTQQVNDVDGTQETTTAKPGLGAQIEAWDALLAGEGLSVVEAGEQFSEPEAGPEAEQVFDITAIAGETDVAQIEAVVDFASYEGSHEGPTNVQGPSSPVLDAEDFEYLSRVRELGGAATFEEVNATPESLAKLTGAGFVNGRVAEQGVTVLAMAGATDRDVWVAANRQVSDNCALQFFADVGECGQIAEKLLARIEKLGGSCDKQGLVDSLDGHSKKAAEAVISELARRGLVKLAYHNLSGYTLIASTEEPADATSAAFANTLRGLLKLDADSARNRKFSWKTFADEASGRRPEDDEAEDRFAFERAANEFRAAAREARKAREASGSGGPLTPVQIAYKMLSTLGYGLDTFRNLAGGRNEELPLKAAILDKLQQKGLVVETEFRGQLAYTLAEEAVAAPAKGGTLPRSAARKAHGRAVRKERTRQAFREAVREAEPEQVAYATARAAFLAGATVGEKIVIRLLKEGTVPQNALYSEGSGPSEEETRRAPSDYGRDRPYKAEQGLPEWRSIHLTSPEPGPRKSARRLLVQRMLGITRRPGFRVSRSPRTRRPRKEARRPEPAEGGLDLRG